MNYPVDPLKPAKRVVIPMRVDDEGHLVPFYNMDMPKLKKGSILELVCEEPQFEDPTIPRLLNSEERVPLLKKETTLFAQMRQEGSKFSSALTWHQLATGVPVDHATFFVPFWLAEDLDLELRGTRRPALCDCPCDIGDGSLETARPSSVNQAYTRLSEKHEPSRRSHTGNVFDKVLYMDADGTARPLAHLRDVAVATFHEKLFSTKTSTAHPASAA